MARRRRSARRSRRPRRTRARSRRAAGLAAESVAARRRARRARARPPRSSASRSRRSSSPATPAWARRAMGATRAAQQDQEGGHRQTSRSSTRRSRTSTDDADLVITQPGLTDRARAAVAERGARLGRQLHELAEVRRDRGPARERGRALIRHVERTAAARRRGGLRLGGAAASAEPGSRRRRSTMTDEILPAGNVRLAAGRASRDDAIREAGAHPRRAPARSTRAYVDSMLEREAIRLDVHGQLARHPARHERGEGHDPAVGALGRALRRARRLGRRARRASSSASPASSNEHLEILSQDRHHLLRRGRGAEAPRRGDAPRSSYALLSEVNES